MDHRRLILDTINHREPESVPCDFGGAGVTGLHCSVVEQLRQHYGLEKHLVKVPEPFSFLGWVDDDLARAMGVSTAMALPPYSNFGVRTTGWKEWRTPWGQEVLIPSEFGVVTDGSGDSWAYPQGDLTAPPSGKMPSASFFFDDLIRQEEFDEDNLDPADNTEEFKPFSDEMVDAIVKNCAAARATGRAVILNMPGTGLGDISKIPGPGLKRPKGIRDIEEWYISLSLRPEHVKRILAIQTEVGLDNMRRLHRAGGDSLCDVIYICGTDFGTQTSTFCSVESFFDIFAPFYRKLCGWVHGHTPWKTFKHSCGAIERFIDPLIEVGFDCVNPVQCSAANMEPAELKRKYGGRITFWGCVVDTQKVMPFGTPEEVRDQVTERLRIFAPGGGFVCASIHNVQARTPLRNFLAVLEALEEYNRAGR